MEEYITEYCSYSCAHIVEMFWYLVMPISITAHIAKIKAGHHKCRETVAEALCDWIVVPRADITPTRSAAFKTMIQTPQQDM